MYVRLHICQICNTFWYEYVLYAFKPACLRKFKIMGNFTINLQGNHVHLSKILNTKYQLYSRRRNSQSIVHVG